MSTGLIASSFTAIAAAALASAVFPPTTRLASRVRPYAVSARTKLGRSADVGAIATSGAGSAVRGLVGPMFVGLTGWLGRLVDRRSDETLALKIRQAGLFPQLPESLRVPAYRARQLRHLVVAVAGATGLALTLDFSSRGVVGFVFLGVVIGATRQRGLLESAIEDRRLRMRIELYTINQLLAVRARAGGGVVQAVTQLAERSQGEVMNELREALRLHRAGMTASAAFTRAAALTPEAFCARTYSLLAVAEERGVDLAEGLLALSEDVREARREAIRRSATKRRAAMLVPTIAILAPVLLIFVGAPLPQLILGWK
jgi:Flp pilus assembly protein TadB